MKIKKGLALGQAPLVVMMIVFIGLISFTAIKINDTIKEDVSIGLTSTTYNETVALVNNTYTALTYPRITSIYNIGNATETILAANYSASLNNTGSSIYLYYSNGTGTPGGLSVDGNYWVYYTYNAPNDMYYGATNSTEGVNSIINQMTLIGLIVVMAIVIGVLWGTFRLSAGGI